ncbi:MAG: thrombospondin type-1 domain-containing protein, partial [Myxococcota bacterium]
MQNTEKSSGSNRWPGSTAPWHRLLLGLVGTLLLAMPAASAQHLYHIALDTDETSATGCVLNFPTQGSLSGFEKLVELRVDPNYTPPRVDSVLLVPCQGSDWNTGAALSFSASGWNAGVDSGQGGGDFVEGFVPLDSLGSPNSLRLAVRSTSISGAADDIDSQVASPMVVVLAAAVPVLEPIALLLLAGALLAVGFLWRRQRSVRVLVALLALGAGGRAVQALPLADSLNGRVADWFGVAELASDPAADTGDPAADLRAFFAQVVGADLVFRFDLSDLEGACNASGDPACDGVCGASDTDPGDCNGVCEVADAFTHSADCDGTCAPGDEVGTFDCVSSGSECPTGSPPEENGTCGWSGWSDFGVCSNSCGDGTQTRTRTCTTGSSGSAHCQGSDTESASCIGGSATCGWSGYGSYGSCSNSCGDGSQTRARSCNSNNPGANCQGSASDSTGCTGGSATCGWSGYGGYSACSNSCGNGSQT